jgi:glycosyltransferase involved in cell wall biosynthesis
MRAELLAQARQSGLEGQVVFTGSVPHDKVPGLLSAAQVAVLNPRVSPAAYAQSPLKLFEYMAAGKAIVAPASVNHHRLLVDRQNALLVPPDDPAALSAAVAELLADEGLRARLGAAARRQALEQHSWNRAVSELETIFLKFSFPT